MERLQKVIANSGYTSRRKAEELISKGLVKVNGVTVYELGVKVNTNDLIEVDGYIIKNENKVYYLLNKPRGIITSTSDDKGRKTVVDLINTNVRIYPVGRLDYDTTGAIILTNDGELANLIMHPKSKIDKVYIAKINGLIGKSQLQRLEKGVFIDGKKTSKSRARIKNYDKKTDTSIVELTIHEGRNHQVKKMFESLGYDVLKLKRERISFLDVNNLKSGEYRILNPKEVKKLYNETTK
ncbi:MAG: rRNA pseudouridine synthase [Lactobacillales bacterium]|nr:rRNA pseudouridine synthase [Lactobacillales bacterium]